MQAYKEALDNFCTYYTGPKLCINAINVGSTLSQLLVTPGGKRILHSFHIYTDKSAVDIELKNLIATDEYELVSKEVATLLSIQSTLRYGAEYTHIGITGTHSAGKWEHVHPQTYISVDEILYLVKMDLLDLEEQYILQKGDQNVNLLEDYIIGQVVISILTKNIEKMPDFKKGFIKQVTL